MEVSPIFLINTNKVNYGLCTYFHHSVEISNQLFKLRGGLFMMVRSIDNYSNINVLYIKVLLVRIDQSDRLNY